MPSRPLTQLTLALLKPDLTANSIKVTKVFTHIQQHDFKIVAQKKLQWSKSEAEAFYGEHHGKFFFERLCGYMTSARLNAPDSLRSLYGMTDTRNSFHGSDAVESARNEIRFFFPEFDLEQWKKEQRKAHTYIVDRN
ncbi:Nucleoside diphosphate kinase 6 [Modicella reniformis]|uniref:Nucleoside diphosphate kinase n=1 Tax=Modicella reniformis TaxID=1440133 RepID=A0A9P6M9L0_9FUNG|nr:Nucleoside diphosphate kinase 6 [Modicella reniformis]